MMKNTRCLLLFEQSITSKHTLKIYKYQLERFLKFTQEYKEFAIRNHEDLLKLSDADIKTLIIDYIVKWKEQVNPNTLRPMIFAIKAFFDKNDREINIKKLKDYMGKKVKPTGRSSWERSDIQKMLEVTTEKRNISLILLLASSGIRIGAIENMKLKQFTNMQDGCKAITVYPGSMEEYITFASMEFSKALDEYLEERTKHGEKITQESFVFRRKYRLGIEKAIPLSVKACKNIIERAVANAGLQRKKIGKRYDIQINHGVRKFFASTIKSSKELSQSTTERLLGHVSGLDFIYDTRTINKLFDEYSKVVKDLIIDDNQRQRQELEEKEQKITELEARNREIQELKRRQDETERKLNQMAHKARHLSMRK